MLEPDVPIPTELAAIQVFRSEDGDPMDAAAEAITLRFESLGATTIRIQAETELRWTFTTHKNQWEGCPAMTAASSCRASSPTSNA